MININTKKKKKKNYTETITVAVFYAEAENDYSLAEGWYEWSEESDVPREKCGELELFHLPNEAYRRYLRNQANQHKRKIRKGSISQDLIDQIDMKAVAKCGLREWHGFRDQESGEETPYTPEIGYNAFTNDQAFLNFVCDLCRDDELFDSTLEEETVKN